MPIAQTIKHVAIIGPGAVGLVLAVRLALAPDKPKVTLIDHRPDRAARLSAKPIRLHTPTGDLEARIPIRTAPTERPDLVILATKAYAARAAAKMAAPWIGDLPVLTIQNGLGVAEEVADELPRADVVTGVIYMGAHVVSEGEINNVARGSVFLGYPKPPPGGVDARVPLLRAMALRLAGVDGFALVEADMTPIVWGKLILNAAINPVAALAGEPNGRIAERASLRALAQAIADEGEAVARAEGIALRYLSAAAEVLEVVRQTADNRCSMLQDLDAGRLTEIDYLNGAIVRAAESRGMPVPANRAVAALIRQVSQHAPPKAGG